MIINAHELKNGDIVEKPNAGWHKVSCVKQSLECVRFVIEGKGYALPPAYGMRVKR